jgi:hypothetical protein
MTARRRVPEHEWQALIAEDAAEWSRALLLLDRVPRAMMLHSKCDRTIFRQRSASAAALSGSTTYRRILATTKGFNSGAANRYGHLRRTRAVSL